MIEEWKDIPGYEGLYQVSNIGRVKSLCYRWADELIMSPGIGGNGYYSLGLHKDNKRKTYNVHQLVAMAFLEHKPDGIKTQINHKDYNRLNNCVDNLEILSHNEHLIKDSFGRGKGAFFNTQKNKWQSTIIFNFKKIHLGYFNTEEDASSMYKKAFNNFNLYNGDAKAFRKALNV